MTEISTAYPVGPVSAFLDAVNRRDHHALVLTLAEDAVVNDQLQEYCGLPAIVSWAEAELFETQTCISSLSVYSCHNHQTVHARIDGNFDRRGMPDIIRISMYFSTDDAKITQLIIVRSFL